MLIASCFIDVSHGRFLIFCVRFCSFYLLVNFLFEQDLQKWRDITFHTAPPPSSFIASFNYFPHFVASPFIIPLMSSLTFLAICYRLFRLRLLPRSLLFPTVLLTMPLYHAFLIKCILMGYSYRLPTLLACCTSPVVSLVISFCAIPIFLPIQYSTISQWQY